jgi:hypothetical protein
MIIDPFEHSRSQDKVSAGIQSQSIAMEDFAGQDLHRIRAHSELRNSGPTIKRQKKHHPLHGEACY